MTCRISAADLLSINYLLTPVLDSNMHVSRLLYKSKAHYNLHTQTHTLSLYVSLTNFGHLVLPMLLFSSCVLARIYNKDFAKINDFFLCLSMCFVCVLKNNIFVGQNAQKVQQQPHNRIVITFWQPLLLAYLIDFYNTIKLYL
jgi:hypothetical protein